MSTLTTTATSEAVFKKASIRETSVVFLAAATIPFLVHLLPSWDAAPLGAHLLPMFWMTFVASYLFGARFGAIAGLAAPLANLLLTGLPAWKHLGVLSCELVVFAAIAGWAVCRYRRVGVIAPLAYVAAKIVSTAGQAVTGVFGDLGSPVAFLERSLANAAAGLVVLTVINLVMVKLQPKQR